MGAMIMFGLVDTIAIVGLIYYIHQRKIEKGQHAPE